MSRVATFIRRLRARAFVRFWRRGGRPPDAPPEEWDEGGAGVREPRRPAPRAGGAAALAERDPDA